MKMKKVFLVALATLPLMMTSCAPKLGGSDYSMADVGANSTSLRGSIVSVRVINLVATDANKPGIGAGIGAGFTKFVGLDKASIDKAAAKKKVAEPMPPLGQGKGSFHLKGLAIDINSKGADGLNALAGPRDKPTGWLESFGLTRPVVGEDWHVQGTGLPPTPDNPVNPGSPTLVAGKDGKPTNLATGKSETLPVEATSSSGSGAAVASASTEVAAGQREQQKPTTPIIINAPTTTTTTVVKNESVRSPNEKVADSNQTLLARVT